MYNFIENKNRFFNLSNYFGINYYYNADTNCINLVGISTATAGILKIKPDKKEDNKLKSYNFIKNILDITFEKEEDAYKWVNKNAFGFVRIGHNKYVNLAKVESVNIVQEDNSTFRAYFLTPEIEVIRQSETKGKLNVFPYFITSDAYTSSLEIAEWVENIVEIKKTIN